MSMPEGHAKRLFLGFVFSITFLVMFALLIAYNSEAESSSQIYKKVEARPLVISIPACDPQETISFYKDLGFHLSDDISTGFDIVCMEKQDTPYKLEISHTASFDSANIPKVVSALSFPVDNLAKAISKLRKKGKSDISEKFTFQGKMASLRDPNGIEIKLIQR